MDLKKTYNVKTSKEYLNGKEININSITPKLDRFEEEKIRKDVNNNLFQIFKKYV